jgi:hypothetical protein
MDKKAQDELILNAVRWGIDFAEAVAGVGGHPAGVLNMFSDESIATMVRNGLAVRGHGK